MSIEIVDKVSISCNIVHMDKIDDRQFEEAARLFRVLGHPMRLAMMESLSERPWCVCELADNLGLNKSAASKHLSQLNSVGVINMEKDGTRVNCTLEMTCALEMMHCANREKASFDKPIDREETKNSRDSKMSASCCEAPKKE
jgi:DNA-binding transcriptional ArsR family regulator